MKPTRTSLGVTAELRRQSLPEQLALALMTLIVDRKLKPGDNLPPANEIAEEFDVSRTVVREALADLMGRGVIARTWSREPTIAMPGSDQLQELLRLRVAHEHIDIAGLIELRLPLEVQSARLAAERHSEEQLSAIAAALEEMATETQAGRLRDADARFHSQVAVASGNPLIFLVLDSVKGVLNDFRLDAFARWRDEGAFPALVEEHRRVYDRIAARDPEGAATAMSTHLLGGLERIRSGRADPEPDGKLPREARRR